MSKQSKRTRKVVNSLCYACVHNCKEEELQGSCEHFERGFTRHEYLAWIREDNVNLKKRCDKAGLSYNVLMRMLKGSLHFKYSYRVMLNEALFEKEEYLPYVEKWNTGNFDDCESSERISACGENKEKIEAT
jgi:hypothetical protein